MLSVAAIFGFVIVAIGFLILLGPGLSEEQAKRLERKKDPLLRKNVGDYRNSRPVAGSVIPAGRVINQ